MGSIVSGLFGAAGSVIGGAEAANAQKYAADQNKQATEEALGLQKSIYQANSGNMGDWIHQGQGAAQTYNNAIGLGGWSYTPNAPSPSNGRNPLTVNANGGTMTWDQGKANAAQNDFYNNLQSDAEFQNILKAGNNGVMNTAAAKGSLYGGNALQDLSNFQLNAYNGRLGQILGVSQQGENAAGALAGVGQATGASAGNQLIQGTANASNNAANAGYYQGNSTIGAFNALGKGISNYDASNPNSTNAFSNAYAPSGYTAGYGAPAAPVASSGYGGMPAGYAYSSPMYTSSGSVDYSY